MPEEDRRRGRRDGRGPDKGAPAPAERGISGSGIAGIAREIIETAVEGAGELGADYVAALEKDNLLKKIVEKGVEVLTEGGGSISRFRLFLARSAIAVFFPESQREIGEGFTAFLNRYIENIGVPADLPKNAGERHKYLQEAKNKALPPNSTVATSAPDAPRLPLSELVLTLKSREYELIENCFADVERLAAGAFKCDDIDVTYVMLVALRNDPKAALTRNELELTLDFMRKAEVETDPFKQDQHLAHARKALFRIMTRARKRTDDAERAAAEARAKAEAEAAKPSETGVQLVVGTVTKGIKEAIEAEGKVGRETVDYVTITGDTIRSISLRHIADGKSTDIASIRACNFDALRAYADDASLPAGLKLRVPVGEGNQALAPLMRFTAKYRSLG